jgi:hypothetical protein
MIRAAHVRVLVDRLAELFIIFASSGEKERPHVVHQIRKISLGDDLSPRTNPPAADAFRRREWSKYVIFLKTDSVSRECKVRTAPAIPRNSLRTIQTSLCARKRNSGTKYGIVLALSS